MLPVIKNATDDNATTEFSGLDPNITYKVIVTATDMAGNTSSSEKYVRPVPQSPTGLAFSNTDYMSTTLKWNASPGADGYDIYNVNGTTYSLVAHTSTTTVNLNSLIPATTYTYYIKSVNAAGTSGGSTSLNVTTLALPEISGSYMFCNNVQTYNLDGVIEGYSVSWNWSSNLDLLLSTNSKIMLYKADLGTGWIEAKLISPSGQKVTLKRKDVLVSETPSNLAINVPIVPINCNYNAMVFASSSTDNVSYLWTTTNAALIVSQANGELVMRPDCDFNSVKITLSAWNGCGTSSTYRVVALVDGGMVNPLKLEPVIDDPISDEPVLEEEDIAEVMVEISPNPASEQINIRIKQAAGVSLPVEEIKDEDYEVFIYNFYGTMVHKRKMKKGQISINISGWERGVYLFKLLSGNQVIDQSTVIFE